MAEFHEEYVCGDVINSYVAQEDLSKLNQVIAKMEPAKANK